MLLSNHLSNQEKIDFNKDGFVFKRNLFSKKEIANIMQSLEGDPLTVSYTHLTLPTTVIL